MTQEIIIFITIFGVGEIAGYLLFYLIKKALKINEKSSITAAVKGHLERLILFAALVNEIPQIFILFGTLKIATRFKEEGNKISNDYFLIGNLVSVLLAIIYHLVWKDTLATWGCCYW